VTYADLSDPELHKLTKRRLQDRPAAALEWRASIDDLRELAVEITARVERRNQPCRPDAPAPLVG
jgi:hypothetical protein